MFISAKSPKGNIGYSQISQQEADQQAVNMDTNNCYNCIDCYVCSKCHDCNNCHDSLGALRWRGALAANLLTLNGLTWLVTISSKQIQIGCQCHTIEAWQQFSDAEITEMDEKRALPFWIKYKDLILMLADTQKTN